MCDCARNRAHPGSEIAFLLGFGKLQVSIADDVAPIKHAPNKSTLDGRATRHKGRELSQRDRKRI